jgi:hypothetical protein
MKLALPLGKIALISASLLFLFSCERGTVEEPSKYVVEGVTLDINRADLIPGDTITLRALLQPYNRTVDEAISWSEDLKDRVMWRSDNSNVAEVDDNGVVVAKGVGSCKIKFILGTYAAECRISVYSFDKQVPYGLWNIEGTQEDYLFTFENTGYRYAPADTSFFDWTFDGMRLDITGKSSETGLPDKRMIITSVKASKIEFYDSSDNDRKTQILKRIPKNFLQEELMFTSTRKPGTGDTLVAVVDMGLPSGNMWAVCNLGAAAIDEDGNRYAWAETTTRQDYILENYKWYDADPTKLCMTKYDDDTDLLLLAEDDPVSVQLGDDWRTPTKADVQELFENCNFIYASYSGREGFVIIPKNEDYADRRLFMPFSLSSEYANNEISLNLKSKSGFYWTASRSEYNSFEAYSLCISIDDNNVKLYYGVGAAKRFNALCIRPVYVVKN